MVIMAQSAANWRNTHTYVDRTHSLTRLHQHSHNHLVRIACSNRNRHRQTLNEDLDGSKEFGGSEDAGHGQTFTEDLNFTLSLLLSLFL